MPRPDDEHPHVAAGGDDVEAWTFRFGSPGTAIEGSVGVERRGGRSPIRYRARLARIGHLLLGVVDDEVRAPRSGLDLRAEGLWAMHVCEEPLEHWTIGLEAFALAVDDPAHLGADALGDRVPLGFDLEWERDGDIATLGPTEYRVPAIVHGEILVDDERIALDSTGDWHHRW